MGMQIGGIQLVFLRKEKFLMENSIKDRTESRLPEVEQMWIQRSNVKLDVVF